MKMQWLSLGTEQVHLKNEFIFLILFISTELCESNVVKEVVRIFKNFNKTSNPSRPEIIPCAVLFMN